MQHFLAVYGYVALLPLAVIEGPVVTVFAAFLAARGTLEVGLVYGIVVIADLVGDVLYYAAGRWLLERLAAHAGGAGRGWAKRLRQRVAVLAPLFRAGAGRMLLFGKLTHSAGFAVLLAAGAANVPMRTFLAYNLLGTLVKSAVLVGIGYWFGQLYAALGRDLQVAGVVMFVLAGGALLVLAHRLAGDGKPPVA